MKITRNDGVNPTIALIKAIALISIGIILIIAPASFVQRLVYVVAALMTLFGVLALISALFGVSKTRMDSIVGGLFYLVLGVIILWQNMFFQATISRLFSFLIFVQAITNLISGYLYYKDGVKGYIRKLVFGFIILVFSIFMFFDPIRHIRAVEIICGIYLILYGIGELFDCLDSFLDTDFAEKRVNPKISIALPVFIAAFMPSSALKYINEKLSPEVLVDEQRLVPVPKFETLEIFIHLKDGIVEGFGHCDFCFDGTVYSYGCYNEHSKKLGGFIARGTIAMCEREPYVEHCLKFEEKKLVGFSIELTKEECEHVKAEIEDSLSHTKLWECDLQICEKENRSQEECDKCNDPASELYRAAKSSYVEYFEGEYKTYFALGSNCVMFTYDIMKKAGLDKLQFSGAITPGTYFAHLRELNFMKNTAVTSMNLYGEGVLNLNM